MLMYKDTTLVPLTTELVEEIVTMPVFKGERPLKKSRIEFLRARFDDGYFYSPRFAIAKLHGKNYRLNGQHSSNMLLERNGEFPEGRTAVIDTFTCEDEMDLAECFGLFDPTKSNRTRSEIANAHGRVHDELDEVSMTNLCGIVSGLAYGLDECRSNCSGLSAEDSARLVHDNVQFVLWANPFFNNKFLARAGVIGAMFQTYVLDSDDATIFWRWVSKEDHPNVCHASRVLARFLRENKTMGGKSETRSHRWPMKAFYVKCIRAWNAYRRNVQPGGLHYTVRGKIPKAL